MALGDLLKNSHQIIASTGAPHALIGAFAMSALGYSRATNDIDYLVDGGFAAAVEQAFISRNFTVFHKTSETLQLAGEGPIDIVFANRPLSLNMLARAGTVKILGVPVLDPADIIGLKIQTYCNNPKRLYGDLADIQRLVEVNPNLDWKRVEEYARLFNEWPRIQGMRS